jgi:hypothetical protein
LNHSLSGSLPSVVGPIIDATIPAFVWCGHSHYFLFTSLRAALAMHDDATISLPRHFSILCRTFLDGPSFSTQKVFSMPASALDLDALDFFFFFFFPFSFLHGVLAFSLSCFFFLLVIVVLVPQHGLPCWLEQGTRMCEDAKIAIHNCVLYRQRDVVSK